MLKKLLIANRGEIAVRIIAAARGLGVLTVAVHSEADSDALHVRLAGESCCIGPSPARESYLNIETIVRVAVATGCDAVHPGYGFLSENADFARAVEDSGLIFVGPDPDTIAKMGDKVAARSAASGAGVPILPGSTSTISDLHEACSVGQAIGYPLIVKACFGGGGRGMRIATDEAQLEAAMGAASREGQSAFGRAEVFLEKYLARPRHIEVQILGDGEGNVVHLGDRDCSVQRRHQKMIEEAPAPGLASQTREAMCRAAVALAQSMAYRGAGTVEFLLDREKSEYFFLEMNTRLQVEHGVTERVTGIDLVEAQLAIAAGHGLPFAQADVQVHGHAIEARISAEDPWEDFAPAPGRVTKLRLPLGPWTRIDFGIEEGDWVQPFYDSMVGKLIAWGPTREAARVRLAEGLQGLHVAGVPTTAPYLAAVLDQREFIDNEHFTGSVEGAWQPSGMARPENPAVVCEEAPTMAHRVSERLVRLDGGARQVAVFGRISDEPPIAMASERARRRTVVEVGSSVAVASPNAVLSPIDATVVQARVVEGSSIEKGDILFILEAMKMEVPVHAPRSAIVTRVEAKPGWTVRRGQLLLELQ